MKFSDIIALAKAGYKPNEIKDLLALQTAEEPAPDDTEPAEIGQKDDAQPDPENAEGSPAADEAAAESARQIKRLEEEIATLKKDLQKAQASNARTDLSGGEKPDVQTQLNDIVRQFM